MILFKVTMPSGGKATITPPLPHPSLCPWKLCVCVTLRIIAQEFPVSCLIAAIEVHMVTIDTNQE